MRQERKIPAVRDLLQVRYLKRFLLARFISNFGNGMGPIALAFGILHMPGGNARELGWVLAGQTTAFLLCAPFGGVVADRFGRVRMLGLMDMVAGTTLTVQALWFFHGHVPFGVMFLCNAIYGATWGVFWPAFSGFTPSIVPEDKLQAGNSLIKFSENSAMIAGAAISGLIIANWGAQWALTIDSISFIFCGGVVFTMRHLTTSAGDDETMISQLVHGWKVFLSFKWIVWVVAGFSFLVMCMGGAENVLGPLIAVKHFHGAKSWALVLTCESIGFIVGSLIGLRIKVKYQMRFLMFITLSLPIYIFTLAGPAALYLIAAAAFAWGVTLDLWGSIWVTALQREVPRESISRVSAFDGMGSLLFKPVGLGIAAPMASSFGIRSSVIIFGIVASAITLATLFQRDVWRMQLSDNS